MISRKEKETTRRGQAVSTKRTALFGLLIALAFVLGYVESLIPVYLGAPGVKLGLANLVTMITLYCMGVKAAIAVNVVRIFLSGFTFGPASAILFSLAGAAFSLTVMAVCRKFRLFGMVGVSILGGSGPQHRAVFDGCLCGPHLWRVLIPSGASGSRDCGRRPDWTAGGDGCAADQPCHQRNLI